MKCKHHKKHYDEKRSAHLRNIQTLEGQLNSKEADLKVCQSFTFIQLFVQYSFTEVCRLMLLVDKKNIFDLISRIK